jgi:hypothetical protein
MRAMISLDKESICTNASSIRVNIALKNEASIPIKVTDIEVGRVISILSIYAFSQPLPQKKTVWSSAFDGRSAISMKQVILQPENAITISKDIKLKKDMLEVPGFYSVVISFSVCGRYADDNINMVRKANGLSNYAIFQIHECSGE